MSLSRCPECNAELTQTVTRCPHCGTEIITSVANDKSHPPLSSQRRSWEYPSLIIIIVATALIYNLVTTSFHEASSKPAEVSSEVKSFESIVHLGNDFMDRGLYDHAIRQYIKALEIDSLHPSVIVDLGACYHAVGENEEAVYQFKRALVLAPDQPVALFNLGVVSLSKGDIQVAKKWWTRFLEVAEDHPQAEVVRERLKKM